MKLVVKLTSKSFFDLFYRSPQSLFAHDIFTLPVFLLMMHICLILSETGCGSKRAGISPLCNEFGSRWGLTVTDLLRDAVFSRFPQPDPRAVLSERHTTHAAKLKCICVFPATLVLQIATFSFGIPKYSKIFRNLADSSLSIHASVNNSVSDTWCIGKQKKILQQNNNKIVLFWRT